MAWDTENAWRPDWHGRWRSHKPGQALVEQNVARPLLRVRNTGTTERLPTESGGSLRFRARGVGAVGYRGLGKGSKRVVLAFLVTVTGFSRKQMERLVRQWRETGGVRDLRGGNRGRPFTRRYTLQDIRLLAKQMRG